MLRFNALGLKITGTNNKFFYQATRKEIKFKRRVSNGPFLESNKICQKHLYWRRTKATQYSFS